jgi:hypothetical protein
MLIEAEPLFAVHLSSSYFRISFLIYILKIHLLLAQVFCIAASSFGSSLISLFHRRHQLLTNICLIQHQQSEATANS